MLLHSESWARFSITIRHNWVEENLCAFNAALRTALLDLFVPLLKLPVKLAP